jgi:2'-hydroxyisoflavone reductase
MHVRVLILGGTAFLGVHLTTDLLARGHDVTHFNRGRTGSAPAGVRTVPGDRADGFNGLEDERFDAVVDTSGYLPHVVEISARFFEPRCGRYVFVSSISVYDDKLEEGFEDSPMPPLPPGASQTVMTSETYGPLKAGCERVVASAFGERSTIVRPGLIAGPLDPTDRFTYWPVRFARGGEILAPGTADRPVQFVDVRDLARFMVQLIERNAGGDYNVTSPQGTFTMGGVMQACADAARVTYAVRWVDDEFLTGQGVAPWMDLPLWIPPSENMPGFMNFNVRRALAAGLTIRPLAETVRDTLAWALRRPREYAARAGIAPARETELLVERRHTGAKDDVITASVMP